MEILEEEEEVIIHQTTTDHLKRPQTLTQKHTYIYMPIHAHTGKSRCKEEQTGKASGGCDGGGPAGARHEKGPHFASASFFNVSGIDAPASTSNAVILLSLL